MIEESPPMDFKRLIAEQQERWRPFGKSFAEATAPAAMAWQEHVHSLFDRREAQRKEAAVHEKSGMSQIIRTLARDDEFRAGLDHFVRGNDSWRLHDEPLRDTGMRVLDNDLIVGLFFGVFEEEIDVFGLPYASQSSETRNGPHQAQMAAASAAAGTFGFAHNIGNEGGSSYCAAALWVRFMRRSPGHPPGQGNPGLAQVRPYVPYDYRWADRSYVATAHNRGAFGVFVTSQDLGGGNARTDQNHQYRIFDDGTSWYEQHNNPAWFDTDSDHALSFGNVAPWFFIEPGRMYSAAVWCWGECDASGLALPTASFAVAAVRARMPFLVVAQSKN
jgi:hypothetical protein